MAESAGAAAAAAAADKPELAAEHAPSIAGVGKFSAVQSGDVQTVAEEYNSFFDKSKEDAGAGDRVRGYTKMVNHYYDLVTDFYEYGWGQSFHFAPRRQGQGFQDSLQEHERFLADQLHVKPGDRILDVGCGVGGPMREIARHTGAHVVGINNNDYQLQRLALHNRNAGLDTQCEGVKGDFMHQPFPDCSFDGAYAVEATCHSPDRRACYAEILRVLKPGATLAMYEWCMTEKYDPTNERQNEIKHGVETGDALPPLKTCAETVQAAREAGFEIVLAVDRVDNSPSMIPWYATLAGGWSLSGFRMTWLGRMLTHNMCRVMEFMRIAPAGTVAASQVLMTAADALVAAGQQEIFTPMMMVVCRKPVA